MSGDDLELLSFRDVAKLMRCRRETVARLAATGRLRTVPAPSELGRRGARRLVPRWAVRELQQRLAEVS